MKRAGIAVVFVLSIALVGAAAFYGGTLFGTLSQQQSEPAAAIVEAAKKNIARPQLPPRPAGRPVTVMEERTKEIEIPIPGLLDFGRTRTVLQKIQVPTTKLVDASPEVVAAWDAQVKKLEEEYNARLTQEIDRLSRENLMRTAKQYVAMLKEIASEIVVPVLIALGGIIGAITALKNAFKSNPKSIDQT